MWLGDLGMDLRYGARSLRKNWNFTAVAVLTLALGIGANTATFSVLESVLLHALPFSQAARVFRLTREYPDGRGAPWFSIPDALDLQRLADPNHAFAHLAIYTGKDSTLRGVGDPKHVTVGTVSPDFLATIGFEPVLGRDFHAGEDQPGRDGVAILAHDTWASQFGGDPGVLGRTFRLDDATYRVIGVLPPRFLLDESVNALVPLVVQNAQFPNDRGLHGYRLYGQLAPGVTPAVALATVRTVAARLRATYPASDADQDFGLIDLRTDIAGDIRPTLWFVMVGVGLVLLIACANLANMILARSAGRQREFDVRVALGAARDRILRQMLAESLLLAGCGAVAGTALAVLGLRFLLALVPSSLPRSVPIGINPAVLAFTACLAFVTALGFGILPALRTARAHTHGSLNDRSGLGGREAARLRSVLVVAETALAIALTVAAGLLCKSFYRLATHSPGIATHGVLTFSTSFDAQHQTVETALPLIESVESKVAAVPGVLAVGAGTTLPLRRGSDDTFFIEGRSSAQNLADAPDALVRFVMPGWFSAIQLPLQAGRSFEDADRRDGMPVAIVNQALAQQFLRPGNPLGQHLALGGGGSNLVDIGMREVVGVVAAARTVSLHKEDQPTLYLPLAQLPAAFDKGMSGIDFAVRTAGDPGRMESKIELAVRSVGGSAVFAEPRTVSDLMLEDLAPQRFNFVLIGLFASMGLLVAAIGIFGVMTCNVTQRRGEIGVRMAFGAGPGDVLRLIVGQGIRLAALGAILGVAISLAAGRLLAGFLFGVGTTDPSILAAVTALFALIALAATLVPSLRASRLDPNTILRTE